MFRICHEPSYLAWFIFINLFKKGYKEEKTKMIINLSHQRKGVLPNVS